VDFIVEDPLDYTAPVVPVSPAKALIVIERSIGTVTGVL